ncbi:serine hydrolase domain-containing protein [Sphingomicrobium arenosum]|uniref:serine hydrolase domain-containing protein n=1 Tax=Sphingomicrobium arenosum TaxID=2233861 RepID=UPI0022401682|nr:serine hydrolase [Sphingomicrobium arenosum]
MRDVFAMLRGCWTILLCCLATSPSAAASQQQTTRLLHATDQEVVAFFDRSMREAMQRYSFPGGAIVVVRDGEILLKEGYGVADLATGRPVDPDGDLFRAASISKLLVWTLVMQDVERGKIELDRDINDYLDFDIEPTFGRPITMRHLMTHSAGFADRFHGVLSSDLSRPYPAVLRDNVPDRVYSPGTTTAYSNYGTALAGYIVQRIDGRSWDALVADRLFRPLGMTRSSVAQPPEPRLRDALVSTYRPGSNRPVEFRVTPLPPMGSLSATPSDMGQLLAMLSSDGRGPGGRVIDPKSLGKMTRIEKPLARGLDGGFGLGLLVGDYRGVRFAGHAGNMSSLVTDLQFLPEYGLGYYFVFNAPGPNDAGRAIRNDLLIDVIDTLVAPATPAQPAAAAGAKDHSFEGRFVSTRRQQRGPMMFNALMDTLDVYRDRGGGLATLYSGKALYWLPAGKDRWREEKTGIELRVERDADGAVRRVASWLIYPAAVYEPAPAYIHWVEPLLKGAIALLLLAMFAAMARRLRHRATARGQSPSTVTRSDKIGRHAFIVFFGCLAGWGVFAISIAHNPANLLDAPAALRALMAGLAIATAPAAGTALLSTVFALRHRGKLSVLVTKLPAVVGACAIAYLLYRLDFINPAANW